MPKSKLFYTLIGAVVLLVAILVWVMPPLFGARTADRVFVAPTPSPDITVHVIFPSQGSTPGLAHYAEHLAWYNTIGQEDLTADLHSNAWASDRAIGYWLSGPPEELSDILGTLKRLFDPITLDPLFAEQERGIILREYDFRMAGNSGAMTAEKMRAFLYEGTPLGTSVLGTPAQIAAIEYDEARAFHAATHIPERASLVVTGDITPRAVQRALRDLDWPLQTSADTEIADQPFELAAPAQTTVTYPDDTAVPRLIWRRVVTLPEPIRFDLLHAQSVLLRDILDTTQPGGLAGPLRFDATFARSFDVQIWPIDEDNVEISFSAAPDRDISLTSLKDAFEQTLNNIAADGIPQETYDRVLGRMDDFWPDWNDDDDTAYWMADYILDQVSAVRTPLPLGDVKTLSDDLSLEAINALLQALVGEGRTAHAFIGPKETFQ
ncbi:MAG: insulinase family protein [Pseudomonadota bacterium]